MKINSLFFVKVIKVDANDNFIKFVDLKYSEMKRRHIFCILSLVIIEVLYLVL
jgi:hypothetical protein